MAEHEEIEEHLHRAHEPFEKLVAGSMAIIAAMLAVVSVFGQHFNTETLLSQQRSSDEWAYYQAKNIRRYSAQMGIDILSELKAPANSIAKYQQDRTKYDSDMKEEQEKAKDFEKERDVSDSKAKRFHIGEVFLEIAIVFSSMALLTKRRPLFFGGAAFALIGIAYSSTAFLS